MLLKVSVKVLIHHDNGIEQEETYHAKRFPSNNVLPVGTHVRSFVGSFEKLEVQTNKLKKKMHFIQTKKIFSHPRELFR